jgi:hypothetical protein
MIIKTCNQFHKSSGKCSLYPLPDVHKPLDRTHLLLVLVLSLLHHGAFTMARDRQKISPVVQFARRKIGTNITSFCMNMKT